MNIQQLYEFCLSKKGVTEHFPFDEDTLVFKVGGKMFCLTSLSEWRWRTKNQHRSRKVYPFRLSIGQRQYKRYSNHVRRQTVDEVSERLA